MHDRFYVRTIIRDDGEKFEFDGREIYLAASNILMNRPAIQSSDVEYTDSDGGEMIRQRLSTHAQNFNGIIYPRTTNYWTLYFRLTSFFQINHRYTLVYIRRDGVLMAQHNAWLSSSVQVPLQPREDYSNWSVTFRVQRSAIYEYTEDGEGNETLANTVTLPLLTAAQGGEVWDEVGEVWDSVGGEWEDGGGGVQPVYIDSVEAVYPIWTVVGEAVNPQLQNNTTDSLAVYNGTVASGQTLVVDFSTGEARLDGALVSRNLTGQVFFVPGNNLAGFNTAGGATEDSEIAWNNVIGS